MKCPRHNLDLRAHGGPSPFDGQMYSCPQCCFHVYDKEYREKDPENYRRAASEHEASVAAGRAEYAKKHGFESFEAMKAARK